MKATLTSPLVCSLAAAALLLGSAGLKADIPSETMSRPAQSALQVNALDLNDLVIRGRVLVVDVRPREAYERAHVPGALSVPLDEITARVDELRSSDKAIVTYCAGPRGENGLKAAIALRELGVKRVRALTGGFQSWVTQGNVVEVQPTMAE